MFPGLPETETELDNLTEFNTATNRRITMLGIPDDKRKGKQRRIRITFNEEEDVINPEDVDPSVGRFRNMVESTIIPKKVRKDMLGLGKITFIQCVSLDSPSFIIYIPKEKL